MNDTFCALPWMQLNVTVDGSAELCCRASRPVSGENGPLRLDDTPFQDIWNSPHMVSVRRSMLEGRKIPDCAICYQHERTMGTSMRTESNQGWLNSQPPPERDTAFARLKEGSEASGHVLGPTPPSLHLWFGNQCNLMCRMCSADYSSRIAMDPVHRLWNPGSLGLAERQPPKRFTDARTWADSPSVVLGELFKNPESLEAISFAGGEPLLQKQIEPVLQLLIERGHPDRMTLFFSTNGTLFPTSIVEKLRRFHRVTLAVSIDGLDRLNEYIRHPSEWPVVRDNLLRMRDLDWLNVRVEPTLQAYNALKITDLLRFCDSHGLGYELGNVLVHPGELSFSALPDNCRKLARQRLQDYAKDLTGPRRESVAAVVRHLETKRHPEQADLLTSFMRFTNALDASRAERLVDVEPELVGLLAKGGFPWRY